MVKMSIDESIDYLSNENIRLKLSENDKDAIDKIISAYLITKANYDEQLKADLVSMLTEMQTEIEECVDGAEGSPQFEQGVTIARVQVVEIIQDKIDLLTENIDDARRNRKI